MSWTRTERSAWKKPLSVWMLSPFTLRPLGLNSDSAIYVPFHGYDVVAKLTLEFVGLLALSLVEGEGLGGLVDVAEGVIVGYGHAAGCDMAVVDGALVDDEDALAVDGLEPLFIRRLTVGD